MTDIHIPIDPIHLSTGTITELVFLDPDRPHTVPDERGCPDCDGDVYDSGCPAAGCTGYACPDCGTGCDLDFVSADDGGRCAQAVDEGDADDVAEEAGA
ncbi:hypothetical protein ACIPW5_11255 [Streptomyces sp. NPDC090077]|uniref:hypothetical protein n=1 Tax=Streptomyces sp. NPDC090077 TaxID=3365938 RepID=UPI0037FDB5A4